MVRTRRKSILAVATLSIATTAHAQTSAQWQGNASDDWQDPSNWSTDPTLPDGKPFQWQLDLDDLTIDANNLEVGSIIATNGGLFITSGITTVDGSTIGGSPVTTFDSFLELDGGDLTLRNLTLDGNGLLEVRGNNDILTIEDSVNITSGFNAPLIEVNDGLLQLTGDFSFDTNFIQNNIDISTIGKAYLSPDGLQDIDLGSDPFRGNRGEVIFDPGDYILGAVNGTFELYEGGRFFSSPDSDEINIGFGNELLLSGGNVLIEPDTGDTHRLQNQNGTIRGFGRVDLSDPNAQYIGASGQIIADQNSEILEIKGAGASDFSPQADTLGTLLATNGATLLINGLNSFNTSGTTVEADGGTVRLIRLTEFELANLHAHDGGDIQVGSPVPSNSAAVSGSLKLEDNGTLIVLPDSTFTYTGGFPFGGPMVDETSTARIDGTLAIDTNDSITNFGLIDLQAVFDQGKVVITRQGAIFEGGFLNPGVLDLGSTGGGFKPIDTENDFDFPTVENGIHHTIRGGGVIDLSVETGIQLTNNGTIIADGAVPLAFVAGPSDNEFQRQISNGGLLKVNPGATMSFSDVLVSSVGAGPSIEVAGTLTLTNSQIEVDQAMFTDGAVVNIIGTTGLIRAADKVTTTGTVLITVNGPMPILGPPSFDAATFYLNDGSELSAGTTIDVKTGALLVDSGFPTAVNHGTIHIRPGAILTFPGFGDLGGDGAIHFGQQGSAQPVVHSDGVNTILTFNTSNTITGQADLSNLDLSLQGGAVIDPDTPAGGIELNRFTMGAGTTFIADLSSNLEDIVTSDQTLIDGTLILESSGSLPEAGFVKYVIVEPNEDFVGQFHTVSFGAVDANGPSLQLSDDLGLAIQYFSDGVLVRVIATGDTTNDGNVDQQDLNIVLDAFGANTNTAGGVGTGDLTGDGVVDYNDFTQVLRGWTSSADPIYSDVPEPGVGLILLGGLGSLALRRRRV